MNQEKINFRVSRDFGETFNASVKFLRQNFKLFFQCILFLAGPFVLLSAIAGAFYQANALSGLSMFRYGSNPLAQFGLAYFLFIGAAIIANLSLIGTVFSYMMVYQEKGPNNFSVSDVGKKLTSNVGAILSVFFVLTIIILLIVALVVGVFVAVGTISPVLAVLLGLATLVGLLILLPPWLWQLSAVYLVKMEGDHGVLDSFGRTRELMRDNFWWTWLIIVCSWIGVAIIAFVFTIPQAAYQMVIMFSSMRGGGGDTPIAFMIVATICTFCSTLVYSLLYVVNAFHYYSLAEQKDGKGLMERINEIGQSPNNNVEQQY